MAGAKSVVVDNTGTTPQILGGQLPQGFAYRVIGYSLTSNDTGIAIIKCGNSEVTRVVLPRGEVCPPGLEWYMVGIDNGPITVAADVAGVRIFGHVSFDVVPCTTPPNPEVALQWFQPNVYPLSRRHAQTGCAAGPMPSSNGV